MSARTCINLLKFLEDPALVRRMNSNSCINDLYSDPWIRWIGWTICGKGSTVREGVNETGTDYNAALVCVFDRVSQKIYENLAQMGWVGRIRGRAAPITRDRLSPFSLTSDSISLATSRTKGRRSIVSV